MLLVFSSGLRYNTGRDYENYKLLYQEASSYDESIAMEMEIGYSALVHILNNADLKVWSFFTICAFLTYVLFFYSYRGYWDILYLGVFFYLTYGFYFYSFNGVRQAVAMSFLAVAIRYVIERKPLKYLLAIIIGALMHKSLYLFLPFYFFIHRMRLNDKIWYILFFISLGLHFVPFTDLLDLSFITDLISDTEVDYSGYADNLDESANDTAQITLGYLVRVNIGFFILSFYKKITSLNPSSLAYYNLALIGILLYNAFSHILFMTRINYYFLLFSVFVLSFIVQHLFDSKKKILANSVIIVFVFLYCYGIYKGENGVSPYQFINF